jgi:hypothetical protein
VRLKRRRIIKRRATFAITRPGYCVPGKTGDSLSGSGGKTSLNGPEPNGRAGVRRRNGRFSQGLAEFPGTILLNLGSR